MKSPQNNSSAFPTYTSRRTHGISRRAYFYKRLPNGLSRSGCRLGSPQILRVVASNLFGRQCSDAPPTSTARTRDRGRFRPAPLRIRKSATNPTLEPIREAAWNLGSAFTFGHALTVAAQLAQKKRPTPGPFTSPYWNATAISTAFWFLVVGVFLLVSAPPQNGVEPAGEPFHRS